MIELTELIRTKQTKTKIILSSFGCTECFFIRDFHKEQKTVTEDKSENFSTSEGMLEAGRVVTVRTLLKGLYEKACQQKLWGLVRHTAGMLGKRVEDLAKAVVS